MTFQEWSQEYLKSAELLKEKITRLKSELDFAPADMLNSINNRIYIMYQMYLECMKTADILSLRRGNVD